METEGKIDIHDRKGEYERTFARLQSDDKMPAANKGLILAFIKDCEAGKTLRNRQRKIIGIARLTRIISLLTRFSRWFGKPFNELSQIDLENTISNLEKGVYKKYLPNGEIGGCFSQSSIVYYKKAFKKFNRWMQEHQVNNNLDCSYMETFEISKEIEAVSKEDVERMVMRTPSLMKKALLMTLFDGGMRAEEVLNIRLKHLTKRDETYLMRVEFSKTTPRTVILPIASKYVEDWLGSSESPRDRESQVFPMTYEGLRMCVIRAGRKVLNRHITPHVMRHASASYYCNALNQFQLCKRYGWSMSSSMPARYIDRQAVADDEIARKVQGSETSKLTKENEHLREQIVLIKEEHDRLKQSQDAQLQMLKTLASQLQAPTLIPYNGSSAMISVSGLSHAGTFTQFGSTTNLKTNDDLPI